MNLFVRDLTVIDSSYLSETRGMVGESWILDISLSGELNEMSMVLDFGQVKKQIKRLVDENVDHKLIIPIQSPQISIAKTKEGYSSIELMRGDQSIHLHCPDEALCLVDAKTVTIASVTEHLYAILQTHLPKNVTGLELTLRTENINGAFYHYSHGLKKHDGNCQRIAHGHRSPIEVIVDGIRDSKREEQFAERWNDIYLGSREDQVLITALSSCAQNNQINDQSHYAFKYTAPQGEFELAIAKNETEVLNSDTTIELLVNFIADEIKKDLTTGQALKVIAYEGVGKGAIAQRLA
ncbi:TPA: 6-carboxytetrahydropterin synthase [Vibrio diabolicus]|uniref:6-carboxytetrahydropterin synthase n=1 Tax=Vibrio sp. D3 TaxID=3374281 RepID=UPI0037581F64